jgi:hypothetical protein
MAGAYSTWNHQCPRGQQNGHSVDEWQKRGRRGAKFNTMTVKKASSMQFLFDYVLAVAKASLHAIGICRPLKNTDEISREHLP